MEAIRLALAVIEHKSQPLLIWETKKGLKSAKNPFSAYISLICNFFEEIPRLKNVQDKISYNRALSLFF